ncbi:uncharacterized protein [Solanum tuberosum]|uniref:uncharacterized protein n=1 Tax=Solanum tuberosum TaxID=4113 RepID=UPI00073A05B1|nr:PREDICTED: uncharacterized protein LOC107061111 [Solanum tuberosum]
MVENSMELFMDNFSVVGDSFEECLTHLGQVLQRCMETNLVLNWEKCHSMVKEGIVLGQKVSQQGLEVDKAKIEVVEKLPPPILVKGIRSFLGHAEFDFEVKDRKGCKNQVVDHLSRLEGREDVDREVDIDDSFPDEQVFAISLKPTPWYADFANYIVSGLMPDELTFYKQKRFMFDVKKCFWDEPYLFRECADHVIRRCVPEEEAVEIHYACHASPMGGHHGGIRSAATVLQSCYY